MQIQLRHLHFMKRHEIVHCILYTEENEVYEWPLVHVQTEAKEFLDILLRFSAL